MTRLYLIRHGETVWNIEGRYQGMTDIPLSDMGIRQASLLAQRFKNIDIDALYSSPLKRAIATAKPIAEVKNMDFNIIEEFREIDFGEWEGGTVKALTEKYGESFTRFFKDPYSVTFPGDGSFENVAQRVRKGLEYILEKHKDQNVAIISHGGILRLTIMDIMGMDSSFYRKTWLSNTSISIIDFKENGKRLYCLNDAAHIEGLKKDPSVM